MSASSKASEGQETRKSIKACLEYLYWEAADADMDLTANLIGAAMESIEALIEPRPDERGHMGTVIRFPTPEM